MTADDALAQIVEIVKRTPSASLAHYGVRAERKGVLDFVLPALGALVCFYLWLSLRTPAKIAGGIWLGAGLLYGAIRTHGFKSALVGFDAPQTYAEWLNIPEEDIMHIVGGEVWHDPAGRFSAIRATLASSAAPAVTAPAPSK